MSLQERGTEIDCHSCTTPGAAGAHAHHKMSVHPPALPSPEASSFFQCLGAKIFDSEHPAQCIEALSGASPPRCGSAAVCAAVLPCPRRLISGWKPGPPVFFKHQGSLVLTNHIILTLSQQFQQWASQVQWGPADGPPGSGGLRRCHPLPLQCIPTTCKAHLGQVLLRCQVSGDVPKCLYQTCVVSWPA